MPTNEQLVAILSLCVRTYQFLSGKEVDKEKVLKEERIVWEYANKVIAYKEMSRARVRRWNKEHPEAHRKHCRDYARRKANKTKQERR